MGLSSSNFPEVEATCSHSVIYLQRQSATGHRCWSNAEGMGRGGYEMATLPLISAGWWYVVRLMKWLFLHSLEIYIKL